MNGHFWIEWRKMLTVVVLNRLVPVIFIVFSTLVLLDCNFDAYQHARLYGDSRSQVNVVNDSSQVQEIVQQGAAELSKQPAFDVPGGTEFRILFESDALLYSKVEFVDGPFKGKIGWIRKGSFDDPRTRMP